MVYLENNTNQQEVFIPRNDGLGFIHTGTSGSYQEGFEDGVEYQQSLLTTTAFTENGEYSREYGWSAVTVDVNQTTATLEEKSVTISADTTVVLPSSGFDGMSAVTVDASQYAQDNYDNGFDDGFDDGYASGSTEGYEEGVADQKSRLSTTAFTENGNYSRENGWSGITVNVDTASTYNSGYTSGYTSGHTDGSNEEKAKLSATTFTANTAVTISDGGYSAITVNVPQTGTSIPLSSITITGNTAITETEKAYSAITVNVPHTGHTDQELEEAYQSGHTEGMEDQKALLSSTAFTENGNYSRENGWSGVTVNVDTGSTYNSGYTSGYTSGHTDGVNEEKAKMSAVTFTANTAVTLSDGSYSAVTVNVPQTGSSLNVEQNKPYTATTNGNYIIKPSDIWSITYDNTFVRRYVFTINGTIPQSFVNDTAYRIDYYDENTGNEPSVGVEIGSGNTLILNKNGWDEDDYGDVDFYLSQGKYILDFDNDNLDSSEFSIVQYSNKEKYDVMSAVTLNVNVDTASTYNSGYTDGQDSIIDTFIAMTATTNGQYGSTAHPYTSVTVNVPQTGTSVTLEEKNISVTADTMSVSPSQGYDAMSMVNIDATDFGNSHYNSGHTDGQNSIISTFSSMTATTNGVYGSSASPLSSITVNIDTASTYQIGFIGGVDSTVYGAYYPIESVSQGINRSYKTQVTEISGVGTTFEFHFTNLVDTSWPYGMIINGYGDNFYLQYSSTDSADTKEYIIYVSDGNGNSDTLRVLTKGGNNIVGYLTITQEGCEYGIGSAGIITSTASTSGDFASVLFSILFNPGTKYNIVFNRMRVIANGTVQKEFIYQNGDIVDVVNNATATTYDYSGNTVTGVFQPRLVSYPKKVLNNE